MIYANIKPMQNKFRVCFYEYDQDDLEFRMYYFEDFLNLDMAKKRQQEFNNVIK